MIKKVLLGIGFFALGYGIAFFADSHFRNLIHDLYLITTDNRIQFTGKNFHLFGDPFQFATFGLMFLIFTVAHLKSKIRKILQNAIILILIFGIALVVISGLNANMRIIECTACVDGIRRLSYNQIDYELILILSSMFSIIPSIFRLVRNRKKASVQQSV